MKYFIRTAAVLSVLVAILLGCKTNVSAPVAVTSVTLDKTNVSLVAETNTTLTATVLPANAANKKLTWSSDKPTIASVDAKGTVTAHKAGTAVITVETEDGGKTTSCKVTVKAKPAAPVAVTGVTLNKNELSLEQGTSEKLTETVAPTNATNRKVLWSSGNTTVATVWQDGTVTAHKAGTAVITVKTEDGAKTATCKVTVKPTPKYTVTFSVEGTPANGTLKAMVDDNEIHSGDEVEKDKTITFTATAESGYEVNKWTISTGSFVSGGTDGSKTATVKIGADTTVNVTFQLASKTYTVEGISFMMKGIKAVTNGNVGNSDYDNNKPHTVSLTAYRIGETEVTQELWQAVMGNNPSMFKNDPADGEVQGKRPVERIDWYQAIAFCNELTKKTEGLGESQCVYTVEGHTYTKENALYGKTPEMDMNKKGFRLPTDAEWEWAAKGGKEDKWAGTNDKDQLKNYAWYDENSEHKTHEVKKKQPNGYGLYDMSGNVSEWCWDWYGSLPNPLPADYSGPAAPSDGRVIRSCGWNDFVSTAACARRARGGPYSKRDDLGFRVACRP